MIQPAWRKFRRGWREPQDALIRIRLVNQKARLFSCQQSPVQVSRRVAIHCAGRELDQHVLRSEDKQNEPVGAQRRDESRSSACSRRRRGKQS